MYNTFKKIFTINTIKILSISITFYILFSCSNQNKEDAKGLFIRGNVAMKEKNYEVAIQKFDDCIKKTPEFADCYNNRGLAQIQLEHPQEAIADFKKALEIDGKFYQAGYNLAAAQSTVGQLDESMETMKILDKIYKDSSFFHLLKGTVQAKMNHFPEATDEYNQAILLNKNNFEAYTNLGFVQFQEKNFRDAKSNFERAIAINPKADFALNNLALLAIQSENYPQALELVNKALAVNAVQPYYLNNKGYVLLNLNQPEEGRKLIEQSLKIDDKNAWAYRNLGIFYLNNNNFAKALTYFQQSEQMDAGVDKINFYIGTALTKMGKTAEAKPFFDIQQQLTKK